MVGLNRAVKVGNSTRITIEGLDIENSDILISTDNLTNSYIQNNVMKNTNQSPCIGIYMNDSHKNTIKGNDIVMCANGSYLIDIKNGEENSVDINQNGSTLKIREENSNSTPLRCNMLA